MSGGGELAIARAAGFPMERVFMHGNNKTPRELREAIQAGVGRIIIDSRIELKRISEIAGELGVEQAIYMRITPGVRPTPISTSAPVVRTRSSASPCARISPTGA